MDYSYKGPIPQYPIDDSTLEKIATEERYHSALDQMNAESAKIVFPLIWDAMANQVHALAVEKGWWEQDRNDGEIIALIHSELSETLEAMREGNPPSEKLQGLTQVEEELADAVIRIMDYASVRNLRVGQAIIAKHTFNKTRPYKHGKKF